MMKVCFKDCRQLFNLILSTLGSWNSVSVAVDDEQCDQ